jgi:uncharacterized protein with PQ loop repeat
MHEFAQHDASTIIAKPSPGRTLLDRVTLRLLILGVILTEGCASLGIHDTASLLVPRLYRSEIVGILAGFGTTFAGLPDLITMLKQRSHESINPRMAAIMAVFQVLWVYYGLLIVSRPVIVWNVLGVVINSVIVGSYFRLRRAASQANRASA